MAKNIIIYSDGTGQVGGLRPDENRSNIYKLYRATRCGPDTDIDPREQRTFYDAGLGSQPPGGAFFVTRAYSYPQLDELHLGHEHRQLARQIKRLGGFVLRSASI
jgi:uncharacterized protein (DUF2235 family)